MTSGVEYAWSHGCRRDVFQRTLPVRLSTATTNASLLPSQLKIRRSS
jgi:hypothetical protein